MSSSPPPPASPPKTRPPNVALSSTMTRRRFLASLSALGGVYVSRLPLATWLATVGSPPIIFCEEGPTANGSFFFDHDNWKRHGIAHMINLFWPGDHGSLAFEDDISPFDSRLPQQNGDDPPDTSPGAYSSCAINAFFDPFYILESYAGNFILVSELDWWSRSLECGPAYYFHRAGWPQQIRVNHALEEGQVGLLVELWQAAWQLTVAMAFGAAFNYKVTNDIGWPGPANHYYHGTPEGSHVSDAWLRPNRATDNGNLP